LSFKCRKYTQLSTIDVTSCKEELREERIDVTSCKEELREERQNETQRTAWIDDVCNVCSEAETKYRLKRRKKTKTKQRDEAKTTGKLTG